MVWRCADLRFWTRMEKASVRVCPDLFFNGIAQATLEKTSMTVSRNLHPSLYLEIENKTTNSACHESTIPVGNVIRFSKFLCTCCRVYASCFSIQFLICFFLKISYRIKMFMEVVDPSETRRMFRAEIALHVTWISYRSFFFSFLCFRMSRCDVYRRFGNMKITWRFLRFNSRFF